MAQLLSPLPTALSSTCLKSNPSSSNSYAPIVSVRGADVNVNVGSLLRWGNYINKDITTLMNVSDAETMFGIDAKNIAILLRNYADTTPAHKVVKDMVLAREAFVVMLCMYPSIKPKLKSLIVHERRRRVLKEAAGIYEGSLNMVLSVIGSSLNALSTNLIRQHFQCSSIGMARALSIRNTRNQLIQLVMGFEHRDVMYQSDIIALCKLTSVEEIKNILLCVGVSVDLLLRSGLDPKEGSKWDVFGLSDVAVTKRRLGFHVEVFKREMLQVAECEGSMWQDQNDVTDVDYGVDSNDSVGILSVDDCGSGDGETPVVDPFLTAEFPGFETERDNDDFAAYHREVCCKKREQYAQKIHTKHKFCMLTCPDYVNPFTDAIYATARAYIVQGDLLVFEAAVSEAVAARAKFRSSL